MPPLEQSQYERRPQNYRVDELPPKTELAEIAAPERDPVTGRWVKGNRGGRLRKLKALGKGIIRLDPAQVAPWLRPYVKDGNEHAARLLGELPAQSEALNALVLALAGAQTMYLALLDLGAGGDGKARSEALQWLREVRQLTITIEGLGREMAAGREGGSDADRLRREAPWLTTGDDS